MNVLAVIQQRLSPLILLMAARYTDDNYWKAGRMVLGSPLGLLRLASYFGLMHR